MPIYFDGLSPAGLSTRFYLDDGTGTFPFDITSSVLLGDGFSFSRGRQDWQGGVTAGELSITLNNADGRFTPGSTFYGSPSPIKVDQRIRLVETVNGTAYIRFTGYVKSWPVAWPAVVSTWSTVKLTATDAQARAERRVLRSVIEEEILLDDPQAYYTLGEPAGATSAADSSGNQQPPLVPATSLVANPVFGTAPGPTTDGLTAVSFTNNGQYLQLAGQLAAPIVGQVCAFTVASGSTFGNVLSSMANFTIDSSTGNGKMACRFNGTSATITTANSVADDAEHVAEAYVSAGTGYFYLDGSLVGSIAVPGFVAGTSVNMGFQFTGSLAHVALFATAPSGARIADHATASLTGFAGESGSARLTRTAAYANLTTGTLDASLTNVPFVDITGKSIWEALQQVADAEMGVAFVDGSGDLTFHNRNRVAAKTSPDLTITSSYITPEVQPVLDDQQIVNYLETSSEATGAVQVARDTTSETTHGRYTSSVSYLVLTDQEALDRANWIVLNFAEPTARYGTLTINMLNLSPAQQSAVLAAVEINAWLQVISMPSQNTTGTTADVVVEGYTEEQSADTWKLTCNVVSRALFDCLILDDPVRGVLEGPYSRLYV